MWFDTLPEDGALVLMEKTQCMAKLVHDQMDLVTIIKAVSVEV